MGSFLGVSEHTEAQTMLELAVSRIRAEREALASL